jgi:hypothetical protein
MQQRRRHLFALPIDAAATAAAAAAAAARKFTGNIPA